jgi:uncharacterized membrane protein
MSVSAQKAQMPLEKIGFGSDRLMNELIAAPALIAGPGETLAEGTISNAVEWLRLAVETAGAAIIAVGLAVSLVRLLRLHNASGFNSVRLTLASYLALALEFQLAADILSTAIAPSWDKIGKLGAIAVIRTALNFFLMKEIAQEEKATGEHPLKKAAQDGE